MANLKPGKDDWVEVSPKDKGIDDWVEIPIEKKSEEPGMLSQFADATIENLPALGAMAGAFTPLGPVLGAGAGGYAGSALKNAYNRFNSPEKAPKSGMEYLTDPLEHGLSGAAGEAFGQKVLGPALNYGLKKSGDALKSAGNYAADKLAPAVDWGLVKAAKIGSNIPEDFTKEYLKRKGNLNPRSLKEIMDELVTIRGTHAQGVADAEAALTKSKFALQQRKDELAAFEQQLSNQLADQKYQAGIHAENAKDAFNVRSGQVKEGLKSKNVLHLVPKIIDGIKALKDKVNAQSVESYAILGEQKGKVSIKPILNELAKGLESLTLNGNPITETDQLAYNGILKTIEFIEKSGTTVTFPEAKFILQRLGKDTNYSPMAGAYAAEMDAIKQQARRAFDESVKNKVPKYKAIMEEVSANTTLLKELSDKFGTPELAMGRLNNIQSAKGKGIDFELLKKLEMQTQQQLQKPIQDYLRIQETLSTPSQLAALNTKLPEHGPMLRTQAEKLRLNDPAVRRTIKERSAKSPQQQAVSDALQEVADHDSDTFIAQKALEPFKKFGQGSVEAKSKALTGMRNYDAEKLFEGIDKATGKPFSQEIKDRAILDQFKKQDTQGSRKTVLGKAVGKAVGTGLGYVVGSAVGGHGGAGAGAVIGFGLDKYSGQIMKAILDGRIGGSAAISALSAKFGDFAPVLVKAAQSGSHALREKLHELKNDQDFKKRLNKSLRLKALED